MIKAVLFDMDGVLNSYPDMFSRVYAQREHIDPMPIEDFFRTYWHDVLIGKVDLKQLLTEHTEAWHLKGDPQQLLDDWFTTEDVPNRALLEVVQGLRRSGTRCYLATNNEPYRMVYVREHMLKDQLDGVFSSADLGVTKPDPRFFQLILQKLKLPPEEIAYFDDSPDHVQTAKNMGIKAYVYESPEQVSNLVQ